MSEEFSLLEKLDVFVAQGLYKDRDALLEDALRSLLRSKPELRARLAIELYRREEVSLSRAAEISGLDLENFKELLREAGVVRRVLPRGEAVQHETDQLLLARESSPCMHTLAHRHGMSPPSVPWRLAFTHAPHEHSSLTLIFSLRAGVPI